MNIPRSAPDMFPSGLRTKLAHESVSRRKLEQAINRTKQSGLNVVVCQVSLQQHVVLQEDHR